MVTFWLNPKQDKKTVSVEQAQKGLEKFARSIGDAQRGLKTQQDIFRDLGVVRIPGVLQRIGIVFLFSAVLYLNCNWKTLLATGLTILISYWFFLGFVSVSF